MSPAYSSARKVRQLGFVTARRVNVFNTNGMSASDMDCLEIQELREAERKKERKKEAMIEREIKKQRKRKDRQ